LRSGEENISGCSSGGATSGLDDKIASAVTRWRFAVEGVAAVNG
jgi:hypothetical protein